MRKILLIAITVVLFGFIPKEDYEITDATVLEWLGTDLTLDENGLYKNVSPFYFYTLGYDINTSLQAVFDTAATGTLNGTYNVTVELDIDISGDQTINGTNNAKILYTSSVTQAITVSKPSGRLTMNDVILDGGNVTGRGFKYESPVTFNSVDFVNIQTGSPASVAANSILLPNTGYAQYIGDYEFNDCDCDNVDAGRDDILGNSLGAGSCFSIEWFKNSTETTVTIDGGSWGNVWGDDGDIFNFVDRDTFQYSGTVDTHNSLITVKNAILGYASRRTSKVTTGWVHFIDNIINNTPTTHAKSPSNPANSFAVPSCCGTTAGQIGDGNNTQAKNHKYLGNTFNGTGSSGQLARLLPTKTKDLEIRGNTFNDYNIDFQGTISGVTICDNIFNGTSKIVQFSANFISPVEIGTGQTGMDNQLTITTQYINKTDCVDYVSGGVTNLIKGLTLAEVEIRKESSILIF